LDSKALENHILYSRRVEFYRGFGYDLEKDRDFILDKSLPVTGEILEIGTGKGHFALCLAKRGFNFTSIDISETEQAIARLNLRYFGLEEKVNFKIEDARSLSFPDKTFDAIYSVNVLHHLEDSFKVLNEIIRLLKPRGTAILSDFTQEGLDIINRCHKAEGKVHDYFKNSLGQAKDFFISKGFETKEFQNKVQQIVIASNNEG
jgi:ubiquinone/menaquinone biosynthesis C-methylase UbiE